MSDAVPTVLLVPGLRDHVAGHWQTLLQAERPEFRSVPPMGREDLDRARRVEAIERAAQAIDGPIVVVAHSGGCITVAHWAAVTRRAVHAALLAVPPDFESPMPAGYPAVDQLRAGGWLPVPRARLPFRSLVALSRNDPLGRAERVAALAADWGSEVEDLGEVGHLNPATGFGPWPLAHALIARLAASNAG
ncbi:MAG: alpha/beta hydrolase [Burkholderiales bacterium]|jgi:predicted alpha/beta hydrolase family esterase